MTTFNDADYEEVEVLAGRPDWQRWVNALVGLLIVVVCFTAGFLLSQRTVKPTASPVTPTAQVWPTAQTLTAATLPRATPKPYQPAQPPVNNMPSHAEFVGFMVNDQLMTCAEIGAIPELWQSLPDDSRAMIREMCGE